MLILPDHWTWDFWLVDDDDDRTHLYFLMAPVSLGDPDLRHVNARIGHAVSTDLRDWEFLGEAIGPGPSGAWDDLATWTGSVIRVGDEWQMYYTGVNRAEKGLVQRIGRARSTDLHHWVKDDGFALEADPRWYEQLDLDAWFDLSWRDPWVYFDQAAGEYRMLVTARANAGALDSRGVIGLARSRDLDEWEVLPPITAPGEFGHLEVPQLERIGGRWVLFFSAYEWAHSAARVADGLAVCGTHYLVADDASGPFTLETRQFFSGDPRGELYAGRVHRTRDGGHVFLAFLQYVDGGPFVGGLSDPFPIVVGADGRLGIDRDGDWRAHVPGAVAAARSPESLSALPLG
ncbi:glycosyl hydrolase family 32 [Agromyces aurantiacus]|uniref:Glycosyl hydrolase family 32 n=1 Tax=Agromyces aurantiacus TaxID=165814 RepID=A0ABV9R186_9MICO|nr:glycosyl hydrolase family 32 [Agromyces aurantiacus]MBM7505890.1 beta-fructofuranosidase [Agromyces aurantiacus]